MYKAMVTMDVCSDPMNYCFDEQNAQRSKCMHTCVRIYKESRKICKDVYRDCRHQSGVKGLRIKMSLS